MANHNSHRLGTHAGRQADAAGDAPGDGTFNLAAAGAAALGALFNTSDATQDDAAPAAVRQIVFIDSSVPDAELLAAGAAPGVLAVILRPGTDGVAQIAAYLAAHDISNLTSIDIVAHGQDGQITLGTGVLSTSTIAGYQNELAVIGAALQPGGDIQLYGCDVAQDAAGVAFLDQLSAATGVANIAASSHLVGAAAAGGSWTLDVNVGTSAGTEPFTAAAESAYPDVLSTTTDHLFITYWGTAGGQASRVEEVGVSNTGSFVSGSTVDLADQSRDSALKVPDGVAVDAPLNEYFVVNDNQLTVNEILVGFIGSVANPGTLYNQGAETNGNYDYIGALALDQPDGQLYFTDGVFNSNAGSIAAEDGVYRIGIGGGTPTIVVSGAYSPSSLALDVPNNLVFFIDSNYDGPNNLDYGSLTPGGIVHPLNSLLGSALKSQLASFNSADTANEYWNSTLEGVAVNPATQMLYFVGMDPGSTTSTNNFIDSVHYTVSGGVVALGTVNTLYSGSGAGSPDAITIDPQDGLFYVFNGTNGTNGTANSGSVEEGSLTATGSGSVSTVIPFTAIVPGTTYSGGYAYPAALTFVSTPTVTASGSISYIQGVAAAAADAGATVSNSDGQGLASATITITNPAAGDALSAITTGTSITATFNTGTLVLSGADTLAHYQTVLDSVKFSSTGAVGSRTLDWTVSDGVSTSPTSTTTVNVTARETLVAGATASFTGGGPAVTLDGGLTVTDASSSTLSSATVVIGGFIAGDTLTVGTLGGLSQTFNNGTLTLSGSASISTYQTALRSVAYSTTPSDTDPTGGGSHTSRTISWSVNDGTITSTPVTSTLNEVHVVGTVTASGSVTYTGTPVALDPSLTVSDVDSGGNLTGATITIGNFQTGDTLQFSTQNGISSALNGGTLTLTGTASLGDYQAALDSLKFATTSPIESVRPISWTISDGASTSAASTSSVDVICFCAGTLIGTPTGQMAVEKLRIGDMVLTAHNGPRPVRWIGKGKVLSTRGKRTAATPVIVRKGALGDNLPTQDLHVTKAHSLYIDGVLIPVEFLVNYRTILWDDRAQEVEIYHIELDSHDLLLANGAPAESFRDDGNRWLFQNAYSGWGLPPQEPCAPVLTGGLVVDAIWRRLLDRAGGGSEPVTADPDLHLIVDGTRIEPEYQRGSLYGFRLPNTPHSVVVGSRYGMPAQLGIARDPRTLGVALRQVTVRQGARFMQLDAEDERLTEGFHDYEPANRLRWTDGCAQLPAEAFARFEKGAEVMLRLGGATRYPEQAERRAA
jgi:hypothetical protein